MNKEFKVETNNAMVVNVGPFKFVSDDSESWTNIYYDGGDMLNFVEQIEKNFSDLKEFKTFAVSWVHTHIK